MIASAPELVLEKDRNVNTILRLYAERVGPLNENIEFRLREYAQRMKEARPEEWFEWMHRGIMTVATKTRVEQRTIAYLLGIYKAWLTYGFGNCRMNEVTKIKNKIAKENNIMFSADGLKALEELVTQHGPLEVYEAYEKLPAHTIDASLRIVGLMEEALNKKKARVTNQ